MKKVGQYLNGSDGETKKKSHWKTQFEIRSFIVHLTVAPNYVDDYEKVMRHFDPGSVLIAPLPEFDHGLVQRWIDTFSPDRRDAHLRFQSDYRKNFWEHTVASEACVLRWFEWMIFDPNSNLLRFSQNITDKLPFAPLSFEKVFQNEAAFRKLVSRHGERMANEARMNHGCGGAMFHPWHDDFFPNKAKRPPAR